MTRSELSRLCAQDPGAVIAYVEQLERENKGFAEVIVAKSEIVEALREGKAEIERLRAQLDEALTALRKIYEYRSDSPDWNMVMAIAGDVVNPMIVVPSALEEKA